VPCRAIGQKGPIVDLPSATEAVRLSAGDYEAPRAAMAAQARSLFDFAIATIG